MTAKMLLIEYEIWVAQDDGKERLHRSTEGKTVDYVHGKTEGTEFPPPVDKEMALTPVGEWCDVLVMPGDPEDPSTTGKRDPALTRWFEQRKFGGPRRPEVGDVVGVEGRKGTVLDIKAKRVKVDFNGPLDGRRVRFHVRVVKELKALEEIAEHVLAREYPRGTPKIKARDGGLEVTVNPAEFYGSSWEAARFRTVGTLGEFGVDRLTFVEEHV